MDQNKFIDKLEVEFGRALTKTAEFAAIDFVEYYDQILEGILSRQIDVIISSSRLHEATGDMKYGKYHLFGSISILLFFSSIVVFFFSLLWGSIILALSLVFRIIGKYIKRGTSSSFQETMIKGIHENPEIGMRKLCANYLAGIILLKSNIGSATMPAAPSECITGVAKYPK